MSDRSFIAAGAMVVNGAVLGEDGIVALGGKVHIPGELADDAMSGSTTALSGRHSGDAVIG